MAGWRVLQGFLFFTLAMGLAGLTCAAEPDTSTKQLLVTFGDALLNVQKFYVGKPDDLTLVQGALDGALAASGEPSHSILSQPAAGADTGTRSLLLKFGDTLYRLHQKPPPHPDDRELVQAAIRGMLKVGAPGATYLTPADIQDMMGKNYGPDIGSIGLSITEQDGLFTVEGMADPSPARRSGLQLNDALVEIGGQSTTGISLQDVTRRLRGPVGQPVELAVRKADGTVLRLHVAREHLTFPPIRVRIVDKIAVVRMPTGIPNLNQVHTSIAATIKDNPDLQGVILDLRDCPGGLLDGSIQLADEFLNGGPVVRIQSRDPKEFDWYNARPGDVLNGRPVVVLINQNTRSGAEILAAALQDRGRAKVVGLPSFGAGTIDTVIPLAKFQEGALRLTTGLVYRVSGAPIQKVGVMPDVIVAMSQSEADRARSAEGLFSATKLKNAPNAEGARPYPPLQNIDVPSPIFAGDYQEARALDLVRSELH